MPDAQGHIALMPHTPTRQRAGGLAWRWRAVLAPGPNPAGSGSGAVDVLGNDVRGDDPGWLAFTANRDRLDRPLLGLLLHLPGPGRGIALRLSGMREYALACERVESMGGVGRLVAVHLFGVHPQATVESDVQVMRWSVPVVTGPGLGLLRGGPMAGRPVKRYAKLGRELGHEHVSAMFWAGGAVGGPVLFDHVAAR